MAKTTTFVTTHPTTGQTAKRTSQSKTYLFAVWSRRTVASQRAELEASIKHATQVAARYEERLVKQEFDRWCTAENLPDYIQGAKRNLSSLGQKLADLNANQQPGKWGVAGWCGRHDLARKLASAQASKGYDVEISEAVAK